MECIGHREATLVNSAGDDFNDDRDDDRCGNGVDGFFDLRLESAEAAERGARCRGDNNQDESNNTPGLNINMGQNGSSSSNNNRPVLGDYVMPVIQGRVLTRTHPQARFFSTLSVMGGNGRAYTPRIYNARNFPSRRYFTTDFHNRHTMQWQNTEQELRHASADSRPRSSTL